MFEVERGEYKVIVNTRIHKEARLSRKNFLDRVKNVKAIRSREHSSYLSFYVTSEYEYLNLKRFHDLIHKGVFDFDNDMYVFAVGIPEKLYNWFRNNKLAIIERQIINWLAALYLFVDENQKIILRDQLYKPVMDKIEELISKYYSSYKDPLEDIVIHSISNREYDSLEIKKTNLQLELYNETSMRLCGVSPPIFLKTPWQYHDIDGFGIKNYNFNFFYSYFNDSDWDRIIKRGSVDSMERVESRSDYWEKWKFTFSTFDVKKSFVYDFFFEEIDIDDNQSKGKRKRKGIPSEVMDKVWRRDEGKCVQCGSNENLEFDHIIPHSKGGADTYRNLQLLCQNCNRKKSNKIG